MTNAVVYLLPAPLCENSTETIPAYIMDAVKKCDVFFAENERTTRRYLKSLWKDMVIDDYEWYRMDDSPDSSQHFRKKITEGKTIGIVSEAGCPGIADPGQQLVQLAHEMNVVVKPLVGPSSMILALMASGMNGQHFQFVGYLPVKDPERSRKIKELETESKKKNCTQVFIETPYRNNQLIDALLKTCEPETRICIAADITGSQERIITRTVAEWKKKKPDLHKLPVIYCMAAIAR